MSTNINQNLSKLVKEAEEMQKKMQEAQEAMNRLVVTGESGGGMVKVTMDGRHDVRKVTFTQGVMDEEKEFVEDLVAAAFNDANHKVEDESRKKIGQLTAGLNIPTDFLKDNKGE